MSKVPCITVNTDASFNHVHKVGGFAFWIKCDVFTIKMSGSFKLNVNSAQDAELMCMANALYMLNKVQHLPTTELIIINSDCLHAFQKIGHNSKNEIGRKISGILKNLRKRTHTSLITKVDFRHVKAHNGTKDSRSYVNDWCDRMAKQHMRNKVKSIKDA